MTYLVKWCSYTSLSSFPRATCVRNVGDAYWCSNRILLAIVVVVLKSKDFHGTLIMIGSHTIELSCLCCQVHSFRYTPSVNELDLRRNFQDHILSWKARFSRNQWHLPPWVRVIFACLPGNNLIIYWCFPIRNQLCFSDWSTSWCNTPLVIVTPWNFQSISCSGAWHYSPCLGNLVILPIG